MALHFVSTSILSSDNGIDFSTEKALETEEAKKARIASEKARPLYLQLAEQKERQQEEYDLNTKKIFAPPKALDNEDVEFFRDLQHKRERALTERSTREDVAVENFRLAMRERLPTASGSSMMRDPVHKSIVQSSSTQSKTRTINMLPKITAKRKRIDNNKAISFDEPGIKDDSNKRNSGDAMSSLLGNYGSDSESEP